MTHDDYKLRFEFDPETDELGEGGFGRVFKAWDDERKEYVALKLAQVRPDQEAFSLLQEYERVRNLRHGNIAIYLDCQRLLIPGLGRYDVAWMKYYQAGHLGQLLEKHRLTPNQKNGVLNGILDGLDYLHSREPFIIHRDLKPANILIVERAGRYHPLITDFGISRQGAVDGRSHVTNTLKAFSLNFAAPEQADGDALRRNADLWSFGVVAAYVWLDGRLPFRTEGLDLATDTGQQRLRQRIRDLDLVAQVGALPAPWQALVRRCLVLDPAQRLASCQEARQLLAPAAPRTAPVGEPTQVLAPLPPPVPGPAPARPALPPEVTGPPPLPGPATTGPAPRARQARYAAGLVLLLAVIGGGWAYEHRADAPAEPGKATAATRAAREEPAQGLMPTAAANGGTRAAVQPGYSLLHRMVELGDSLFKGVGAQDAAKARAWYQKAADAGSTEGMNALGVLFMYNYRNPDYVQARAWFRKAADAGSAAGMTNLGVLYENGQGVKQDYAKARAWYQKATDAGSADAKQRLQKIKGK